MSRSHSQPKSDLSVTDGEAAQIGGRIRKIRGAASQREFAGRLGISREQLSRIESGAQVPGTETLRRLAQVTRVPVDFVLFGGSAESPRASADQGGGSWEAALEPLLDGTKLRLHRASASSGRKADRAWQGLSGDRRETIRTFVRQTALIAVAIEALLPVQAAKIVIDHLGRELSAVLTDRILEA